MESGGALAPNGTVVVGLADTIPASNMKGLVCPKCGGEWFGHPTDSPDDILLCVSCGWEGRLAELVWEGSFDG